MLQIDQLLQGSAAKASFDSPLELLYSCHDKILHYSSALQSLCSTLLKEGWSPQLGKSADQIRRYFNIAGPEHHMDEEKHLFPAIIALDPELKQSESQEILQQINQLIKEHVESDILWESLDSMLEERSEDYDTLEELARQFASDMHEHAGIENEIIFPYAKEHISADNFKQMGAEIAKRRGIKLSEI